MPGRYSSTTYRICASALLVAATLWACEPTTADDNGIEHAQLAQILRQLDMIERSAQQAATSASTGARYRFDYARLSADIARVRAGIEDYLSPPRAQPRDPEALLGKYRRDESTTP